MSKINCRSLLCGVSVLALLAGCAVGPDYERPSQGVSPVYDQQGYLLKTDDAGGVSQRLLVGQTTPRDWWRLFQSPALDGLVEKALANNPDIDAAEATLRNVAQLADAAGATLYPELTGSYDADRRKTTGASGGGNFAGSIYNLHNASLTMSYGLDIFGKNRRTVEQAEANVDVKAYELDAARLTLAGNVVTAAIKEASLREQIVARNKSIEFEEKKQEIVQKRVAAGAASDSDLQDSIATLQKLRATLPVLQQELDVARIGLAALLGEPPNKLPDVTFDFSKLKLPLQIPVALPVRLLEHRPDILAAEAQLRAASAGIGVAVANRLPGLTLSGTIGSQAAKFDQLFTPGSGIWTVGASLSETIFDAGALQSKQHAAEAEYDRVKAVYRKTVLSALGEVAGGLRALQNDAKSLQSSVTAFDALGKRLQHVKKQQEVGAAGVYEEAVAAAAVEEARITMIESRAVRYADTAALLHALGGGTWNKAQKGE